MQPGEITLAAAVAAATLSVLVVALAPRPLAGLAPVTPVPWYLRRGPAAVAVGGSTGLAAVALVPALAWAAPGALVIVACAAAACLVDLASHRLPNVLVLRGWGIGAVLVALGSLAGGHPEVLLRAAAASAATWALLALIAWLHPPGLGFGDVKLAGALALVTGALSIPAAAVALCLAFVIGGVTALGLLALGRASRGTALPFGPVLLAGTLAALTMPVW